MFDKHNNIRCISLAFINSLGHKKDFKHEREFLPCNRYFVTSRDTLVEISPLMVWHYILAEQHWQEISVLAFTAPDAYFSISFLHFSITFTHPYAYFSIFSSIPLFLHFFFSSSITFTSLDAYFPPQSSISIYFSLKRPDKNVIHTWRLQNYFVTPSRSTDGKDWKSPPIGKSNGGEMARKQKAKRQMGHKSVQVRQSKLTYRLEMAKCKCVGIE